MLFMNVQSFAFSIQSVQIYIDFIIFYSNGVGIGLDACVFECDMNY
jgi:hypothetical protein